MTVKHYGRTGGYTVSTDKKKKEAEEKRGIELQNTVYITPEALVKCKSMIEIVDDEVGGLLVGSRDQNNDVVITDVKMVKQTVTASAIDFDEEDVARVVFEAVRDEQNICGWVHSHVNMDVFWSVTDLETIQKLRQTADNWIVSIVMNKSGESLTRVDFVCDTPFGRYHAHTNGMQLKLYIPEKDDIYNQMNSEIDSMVSTQVYSYNYAQLYGIGSPVSGTDTSKKKKSKKNKNKKGETGKEVISNGEYSEEELEKIFPLDSYNDDNGEAQVDDMFDHVYGEEELDDNDMAYIYGVSVEEYRRNYKPYEIQ